MGVHVCMGVGYMLVCRIKICEPLHAWVFVTYAEKGCRCPGVGICYLCGRKIWEPC